MKSGSSKINWKCVCKNISSVACNVKITAYIAIVKGIIVQAQGLISFDTNVFKK